MKRSIDIQLSMITECKPIEKLPVSDENVPHCNGGGYRLDSFERRVVNRELRSEPRMKRQHAFVNRMRRFNNRHKVDIRIRP